MPRRRRPGRVRRHPAGPHGDLFLLSDGVTAFFAGDTDYEYPNVFLARAAWEECRASTWGAIPNRGIWPPMGAVVYDGITEHTHGQHPTSRGRRWDLDIFLAALELDVESVATFRREEPAKAATIVEALDEYLADLGVLRSLAEQLGDLVGEGGHRAALRNAWVDYEVRRLAE